MYVDEVSEPHAKRKNVFVLTNVTMTWFYVCMCSILFKAIYLIDTQNLRVPETCN